MALPSPPSGGTSRPRYISAISRSRTKAGDSPSSPNGAAGFAGYVTLLWVSAYGPFAERQVPEISDLNVLPAHRRQGIGSALLDCAESAASARSNVAGLGVGLY
jgi:GNAT superfamily N-acetyltransferase